MKLLGPTKVEDSGQILTSFAGTNYLGLSFHPRILEALANSARASGLGLGSSRKTTGTTDETLELEEKLAHYTGAEAALVTTSGTLANIGLIEGLQIDHWLIDSHSHASFTTALPLSGAKIHPYPHLNAEDLSIEKGTAIFTDAVFGLTGEIAPLQKLAAHDALLVIDEAHSFGVFGKGLAEHSPRTLVSTTFTKALGCIGGAILGPRALVEQIRERSAFLAATSAISPALAAAAITALDVLQQEPDRIARLHANTRLMRELLHRPGRTPIFYALENAGRLSALAREAGFLVPVLKSYPGAPEGGMLRWIVSSEHSEEEIQRVAGIVGQVPDLAKTIF